MTTSTSTPDPLVRDGKAAERRWFFGGGLHTWLVHEAESNGAFLLFEDEVEGGKMTPLHIHPHADETMYVLEGEIVMHLDGEDRAVTAGGVVMAPRGLPHAFVVVSERARLLCLHTPGSCEDFYREASEPLAADGTAGVVDLARIRAAAAGSAGIELLGPPPFAALIPGGP